MRRGIGLFLTFLMLFSLFNVGISTAQDENSGEELTDTEEEPVDDVSEEEPAGCEDMTGEDKDFCFFGRAMNERDISYCASISQEEINLECNNVLMDHAQEEDVQGVVYDDTGVAVGIDSDTDGVPNELDKCPDTSQNTGVNEEGCEVRINTVEDCVSSVTDKEMLDEQGRTVTPDDCYMFFAFENKDSSYCSSIQDISKKESCESSVGGSWQKSYEEKIEKETQMKECPVRGMPKTAEECKLLTQCTKENGEAAMSAEEVDRCIHNIAWMGDDISICEEISKSSIKEDCKKSLGGDFEGKERHGPRSGMPTLIPEDLIEAGAGQDFIDMFCTSVKSGVENQMKTMLRIMVDHFNTLNSDSDLSFLQIDVSPIEEVLTDVSNYIDGVCLSTPATFAEKVVPLKEILEGENSVEVRIQSVFRQFDNKMRTKMKEFQGQIEGVMGQAGGQEDIQNQLSDLQKQYLGSFSVSGQNLGEVQMESIQELLQASGGQVEGGTMEEMQQALQEFQTASETVRTNFQTQMAGVQEQAQSMGASMEKIGKKIESIMQDLEAKMKEKEAEAKDFFKSDLKSRFVGMKRIFQKVVQFKVGKATEKRDSLKADGLDTTPFDNALSVVNQKVEGLMDIFDNAISKVDSIESESVWDVEEELQNAVDKGIEELGKLWEEQEKQVEATMKVQVHKKQVDEFVDKLNNFKEIFDEKLARAKELGLDTAEIERQYNKLVELGSKAETAYANGDYEKALTFLAAVKAKYELINEAWTNLNKQTTISEFIQSAKEIIKRVDESLLRARVVAENQGIDISALERMITDFKTLVASIETDDADTALEDIGKARDLFKSIKLKWDSLARGEE